MFQKWSTYCAGLALFALASCSTYRDVRDWWTQDTGPTEEEWAAFRAQYAHENDPPPQARTNAIQESRPAPLAIKPKSPPRIAKVAPPQRKVSPDAPSKVAPQIPSQMPAETPSPSETIAAIEVPILTPKLSSVTGMSEANLRQALGAPSSATETGTQKIWRYTGNGCSVEILFFRDVTRNTYAALDHRTLARDGQPSSRPCLRYAPGRDQSG